MFKCQCRVADTVSNGVEFSYEARVLRFGGDVFGACHRHNVGWLGEGFSRPAPNFDNMLVKLHQRAAATFILIFGLARSALPSRFGYAIFHFQLKYSLASILLGCFSEIHNSYLTLSRKTTPLPLTVVGIL